MKKSIFAFICLLLVVPCQARTITVEAPQEVSIIIEADDFSAGTNISAVFDDITLSKNGTGPVYAVTSIYANGQLGTNSIGDSASSDVWENADTFRVDFNGFAKKVTIRAIRHSDLSGSVYIDMKAYNSVGTIVAEVLHEYLSQTSYRTIEVSREYFDISYVTINTNLWLCIDHLHIDFLPSYHGSADFDKIQDAIDNANDGDTIEVLPGTYYERINYYGLSATITSIDPEDTNVVSSTIINATGSANAVTFESLESEMSVLTGFTISNSERGIYCYYSDPLITNCVIKENTVAGIYCDSAAPTILENFVQENLGVGIIGSQGEVSNCVVRGNSANGLYNCQGLIENCIISDNLSNGIDACLAHISNCSIVGNKGHGVSGTTESITDNIIVKNWNYGVDGVGSDVLAYNNIWGNLNGSYSNVIPCPTDIHKDPRFAIDCYWDVDNNWVEGEYHLKSNAGRWTESGWVYDDVNSPCIDAGDPCEPIGSEPNPNGGRINMGAYGGTVEASKSPSGIIEPICSEYPAMDFNKDCKVDFEDFAMFSQTWLDCNLDPPEACRE